MFRTLFIAYAVAAAPSYADTTDALIEQGRKQFVRCVACHTMSASGRQIMGPHLSGIVGRQSGAVETYAYTPKFKEVNLIWTEENLDKFLEKPSEVQHGLCMPFTGLPNPENRQALIAYMKKMSK